VLKTEPRVEPIRWLAPGEAHCGDTEVLLMAILVVNVGTTRASIGERAKKLLLERSAAPGQLVDPLADRGERCNTVDYENGHEKDLGVAAVRLAGLQPSN
jgi:hypothetical protein